MKPDFLKSIRAQPRLITAGLVGGLLCFVLPGRGANRLLLAWDCSTGLYLVLALTMMARSNLDRLRSRAAIQDEGQAVILGLTTLTAVVSLAGVMMELALAKSRKDQGEWPHVALAVTTVVLSWSFLHTIFAVHYAHEYYSGPEHGLEFPGGEPPDYWDFVYYAYVIGTACATADVNTTSRRMRKITTFHCVVAFFFNTTVLALAVNIGASFF
jgi:uncharacterized membrane protein